MYVKPIGPLLVALLANGPQHVADLARRSGRHERRVRETLGRLERAGIVGRHACHGPWFIAENQGDEAA